MNNTANDIPDDWFFDDIQTRDEYLEFMRLLRSGINARNEQIRRIKRWVKTCRRVGLSTSRLDRRLRHLARESRKDQELLLAAKEYARTQSESNWIEDQLRMEAEWLKCSIILSGLKNMLTR